MNVSIAMQRIIWGVWFVMFPFAIWHSATITDFSIVKEPLDLLLLCMLVLVLSLVPIVIGEVPVFFVQGVMLTVFLSYGLFFELLFTQISVLVVLWRVGITKRETFRYPLNSLMFIFISYMSMAVYVISGGKMYMTDISPIWLIIPIVFYQIAQIVFNHVSLAFMGQFIYREPTQWLTRDLLWELTSNVAIFPIAVILFLLYHQLGVVALIYLGIPFASIAVILKMYHESSTVNGYLQKASSIGHQLTGQLEEAEISDFFIDELARLLNSGVFFLYLSDGKQLVLQQIAGEVYSCAVKRPTLPLSLLNELFADSEDIVYLKRSAWAELFVVTNDFSEELLCFPVVQRDGLVGFVGYSTTRRSRSITAETRIIDLLSTYLGIALQNANQYSVLKKESERCPLTNLYNYRYFDRVLQQSFEQRNAHVSLIFIDLDYFKKVNDTYGHEAGNDVLRSVAQLLTTVIPKRATVARYGGEEFVVLLPNGTIEETGELAELIRGAIQNYAFATYRYLQNREPVLLDLTASLGFAVAPYDADHPTALIRCADRAMYIGAKQSGRNRVASYAK